jgi:hypothetical protein
MITHDNYRQHTINDNPVTKFDSSSQTANDDHTIRETQGSSWTTFPRIHISWEIAADEQNNEIGTMHNLLCASDSVKSGVCYHANPPDPARFFLWAISTMAHDYCKAPWFCISASCIAHLLPVNNSGAILANLEWAHDFQKSNNARLLIPHYDQLPFLTMPRPLASHISDRTKRYWQFHSNPILNWWKFRDILFSALGSIIAPRNLEAIDKSAFESSKSFVKVSFESDSTLKRVNYVHLMIRHWNQLLFLKILILLVTHASKNDHYSWRFHSHPILNWHDLNHIFVIERYCGRYSLMVR